MTHSNNLPSFAIAIFKPTHSNMYIHALYKHSYSIKLGTILSLFLRAYRICDMQNIDSEIQFIFITFKTLCYDHHFIEKAHFQARATFYRINKTNENQFHNVLVLPPVCDKFTARKLLPSETRIVHITNSTTKSYLCNSITKGSV